MYPRTAPFCQCYNNGKQPVCEVLFGDSFAVDGSEPVQAQSLWSMESWRMASVYYGSPSAAQQRGRKRQHRCRFIVETEAALVFIFKQR